MKHEFISRWKDYNFHSTIFLLEVAGVLIFSIGYDEQSLVIGLFNFGIQIEF